MKKVYNNKYLFIITILIIIVLSSFFTLKIFKNYNIKYDIQGSTNWEFYDKSIENIKNNMESITEPNENFTWWILKDFDIKDDNYESSLNQLVATVRMCYIEFTDDGTNLTNSNPIRKFKNKEYITKKELEKLNFNMYNELKHGGCLSRFDRFNAVLISEDEELTKDFLEQINKIITIKDTKLFTNKNATYNELLLRKTMEVHLIEDMSEFLVKEYYKLR